MSRERRGLGKGLEALISQAPARREEEFPLVQQVPVDQIAPNPHQPRRQLDADALRELADSIRIHGVLQPLVLARAPATSPLPYHIVAGERRWRAAQMAGLSHVPALVKDASSQQLLEWALVENLQRTDLNPLEAATAYRNLMEGFGLTQAQVAERVGKSRSAVANTLRLLNLTPDAQAALLRGEISEGHGRALLALADPALQREALHQVLERRLSVRETEALVRRLQQRGQEAEGPGSSQLSPQLQAIEEAFRQALGTRVQLRQGRRGGQLVIHFYSAEELQAIYEVIVGRK